MQQPIAIQAACTSTFFGTTVATLLCLLCRHQGHHPRALVEKRRKAGNNLGRATTRISKITTTRTLDHHHHPKKSSKDKPFIRAPRRPNHWGRRHECQLPHPSRNPKSMKADVGTIRARGAVSFRWIQTNYATVVLERQPEISTGHFGNHDTSAACSERTVRVLCAMTAQQLFPAALNMTTRRQSCLRKQHDRS